MDGAAPPAPPATGPGRGTAVNATVIVAAQSTQAIAVGAVSLFLPIIRADLGLTFAQAGALAAIATLTYAVMQIPSGLLADRLSPKLLFGIGILGANALAIAFALSNDYIVMMVTQAVAGVFRALMFIPGMLLITRHFAAERRATAMGLFVAGGFTSNIVVSLLGPLLVGPLGWQGVIVLSSVLGLLVLVAFWLLADDGTPPESHGTKVPTAWVWRTRAWWLLGVIQFARLSIVAGFGFWLPAFLIEDVGLPLQLTGLIVAVSAALTAPANIGGGILSDRLGRPLLVIGGALASLAVLLAIVGLVRWLPALLVVIGAISLVIQVYFGPLFAVPAALFGPGLGGLSSGFGNLWANLGGFSAALLLGVIRDATHSFTGGFLYLAVLAVIGFAATAWLARSSPPLRRT
jgi:DHA1 family inner membrane transport protein